MCAVAALAAMLAFAARAANPAADEQIAVAKQSLARAEQAGAPQDAPTELASARDKLAQAEKANTKHDKTAAERLAEQANVDAQVAEATALQQHSHKAATEFDASMQTLQQEAQRNTQAQ
jgi:hypothetical protein